ncbi:glycosyltransferase [Methylobacterium trifolii]
MFNIGNNEEHHQQIFEVMRNYPGVVICHDYVYQHFLARMVDARDSGFADYVALFARYGTPDALRRIRQSNITQAGGLRYGVWDSDFSASEPLGAPLIQLGSALVVHSAYAEAYVAPRFEGPVLRLGMPHDQRTPCAGRTHSAGTDRRRTIVSFGHVQPTKCIDDILLAIAGAPRLRDEIVYVISGFSGSTAYLDRLRGLIHEHALDRCVRFALDLTDAELGTLSSEADAFVNLRYPNTEGASVSLIEQLVTGKPVMVFDTGCYAEIPDDAVVKVSRPRDIDAIAVSMVRLLGDREALAAIGARGRAHAMRTDCRGYAAGLLDFLAREEVLLRRRAAAHASCLIDLEAPAGIEDAVDDAWAEALATARATFDLLEQSRLALDPMLIRSLGPERIVDYVQAAILRQGTNQRLTASLQAYFRPARDAYRQARTLQIVHDAAVLAEPDAVSCLPDVVPHGDLSFWEVVAALGANTLALVAHHAFFESLPAHVQAAAEHPKPADSLLWRLRLADALEQRDVEDRTTKAECLETFTAWLRQRAAWEAETMLDPLPVGQKVVMGSANQKRFVRMIGFCDADSRHPWTGPELALVYLSPTPAATRITLFGHMLHEGVSVTITAVSDAAPLKAVERAHNGGNAFEIALPRTPAAASTPTLCLTIQSTGCSSPAALTGSQDTRLLGFMLHEVAIH